MKTKQKIISAVTAAMVVTTSLAINASAEKVKCDINGDGYVNAKDALVVLKLVVNGVTSSEYDVNNDGYVNAKDALFILKTAVNLPADSTLASTTLETKPQEIKASILENYEQKWAYNTLSDRLKKVYAAIYDGATRGLTSIDLSKLSVSVDELQLVFWACDFDNPQLLNVAGGYVYSYLDSDVRSIAIMYGRDINQTTAILKEIEARTASVISNARKLPSDYERVKFFHDWIIDNTKYVLHGEKYISELDGPVIHGEALCEGYSRAFAYLCQSVGIPCVCIHGHGNGGDHMWNMVQIEGNWYHIDVTWVT